MKLTAHKRVIARSGLLPAVLLPALLLPTMTVQAGGPLIIAGDDGHTPVRYQNPVQTLDVESGDLGSISNAQANALLADAIGLWNQVAASTLLLKIDDTTIATDINVDNFENYLPAINSQELHDNDSLNPVVYDTNGEIIDAYFGAGQSDFTIGVAASIVNQDGTGFSEGYVVINGKDLGLSPDIYRLLMAHEIAHYFGLDHTQTDISNLEDTFGIPAICSTADQVDYAVMYPFICRETATLHADDISALVALYPTPDYKDNYGILQGRFVDPDGKPILGANIWASNVSTGEAISVISDYLLQDNGFYKLVLPPGNYTLHANSVNTRFVGASGVGPYSLTSSDISFQPPHPLEQVDYHGSADNNDAIVISIAAGQTRSITFSSAGILVSGSGDSGDQNDSIADLFGGLSPTGLIALLLGLLSARGLYRCRRRQLSSDDSTYD